MEGQGSGELGQVLISADVIEQLVVGAIAEQEGLLPLGHPLGDEGIFEALAKAYKGSGVEVTREGERLKIRLQMIARYGTRIPEAARQLISLLRRRLEELAGLEVVEVELEIKGLKLP
jgi:uncharacterized alkaline shock family protein YloU